MNKNIDAAAVLRDLKVYRSINGEDCIRLSDLQTAIAATDRAATVAPRARSPYVLGVKPAQSVEEQRAAIVAKDGGELLTPTQRLAIAEAVRKAFPHVEVPHNVYDQIAWNTEQACYVAASLATPKPEASAANQQAGEATPLYMSFALRKKLEQNGWAYTGDGKADDSLNALLLAAGFFKHEHPNLSVPIDAQCSAKLDQLGDDRGQGLDGYWKSGFRAGWHHARLAAPISEDTGNGAMDWPHDHFNQDASAAHIPPHATKVGDDTYAWQGESEAARTPASVGSDDVLPKWIDDAKGKDPFTDDLITEIIRLRASQMEAAPPGKEDPQLPPGK